MSVKTWPTICRVCRSNSGWFLRRQASIMDGKISVGSKPVGAFRGLHKQGTPRNYKELHIKELQCVYNDSAANVCDIFVAPAVSVAVHDHARVVGFCHPLPHLRYHSNESWRPRFHIMCKYINVAVSMYVIYIYVIHMYCKTIHCSIYYYIIFFINNSIVSCCTVSYCVLLCCFWYLISRNIISYDTKSCIILYYAILYRTLRIYTILWYTILCYVIKYLWEYICDVVLNYVIILYSVVWNDIVLYHSILLHRPGQAGGGSFPNINDL